jgi:hypothetical protein
MLCLGKLDRLCIKYMVRHTINNRILHIAHVTQVTHPHRVPWADSSRVALLHWITRGFWPTLAHDTQVALWVTLFMLMLVHLIKGAHPWVIWGFFLLLAYLIGGGGTSTSGNPGLPAHVTQPNPGVSPNFQQPYYQKMAYGPNIPPMGTSVPHGPIPDILFLRTPAYATPNPQVRDQIARTLREFGFTPKGWARSYQKPYPEYFDTIPFPRGFWVPDLAKFTGDDAKATYEHIG